mgnify:CR=1 FL=1
MNFFLLKEHRIGEVVTIMYLSKKGVITKRTIQIVAIKAHSLLAYCYLRRGLRRFEVERVLAFELKKTRREHSNASTR